MCLNCKTLGKSSSSEATTPETCGNPPLPDRSTLNVSDEYANTVKTESHEMFRNRIHRFSGYAMEEKGRASDHSIVRFNGFLEELLDPNQESINAIIQSKNLSQKTELLRLICGYFDNSEDACKGCGALQKRIHEARQSHNKIKTILDVMPAAGEFSEEQCRWIIEEFRLFVDAENPFAQSTSENLYSCFRDLLKQMELSRNLAGIEPKWVNKLVCLDRVLVTVGGSDAICLPVDSARKRVRHWKEHRKQLDAAVKGCYVLSNHVDTMSRLVTRLHQDIEHSKVVMKFCLQRKYDRHPVEEAVKVLKKNDGNFTQQLYELEDYVCFCVMNINRVKSLLFQQINES